MSAPWPWCVVLSNGSLSMIDEIDYVDAFTYQWYPATRGGYVVTNLRISQRASDGRSWLMLHDLVLKKMGEIKLNGQIADHRNRDRLDNRRTNLRYISLGFSTHNKIVIQKLNAHLPSGVKPHNSRFQARIKIDKKEIHLGTFDTPDEASYAYKAACLKYYGEIL